MERTRSNLLTFFAAIFSNTEVISEKNKKLNSLRSKDYINAGVTEEEQAELAASLSRINKIHSNGILKKEGKKKNKKELTDELEERYGPAKSGNPIYDQGQKMNNMEKEEKERTRDK